MTTSPPDEDASLHHNISTLSPEQHMFVHEAPGKHQSLQSWAGTGKTYTLIERVVNLITVHGVDPASIIITTFTVEGAKECLTRLNVRLGHKCGIRVGTMDSLAYGWMRSTFQHYTGIQEYGPLLLDHLRSPDGQHITASIRYLIVDEFQDLSQVQLDTVMEFHKSGTAILAIGDVAQNIYEWRGCHGHFFSGMRDKILDLQEYRLTINRRCTPEIIDLGNACLRVLRHPRQCLMRPARPSLGQMPILDTLEPMRSMGAHVLRILRRYSKKSTEESTYGSMAVISRFKQGLFNVEESIICANRTATCRDALIPFVTSASIGDGGDGQARRKEGHLTLMTVHQAKGLEWQTVILVLWDPQLSDEEWRLLYVAVTRARDVLHIVSPNAKVSQSILDHISKRRFVLPNGMPLDGGDPAEDKSQEAPPRLLHAHAQTMPRPLADVIRGLSSDDIRKMRDLSLIPLAHGIIKPMPGCSRILRRVATEDDVDDVDSNGLQTECGYFVNRWITRLMWSTGTGTLSNLADSRGDRDTLTLLETVVLPKDLYEVCQKHTQHVYRFLDGTATLADVLHDVDGCDPEDVKPVGQALDRVAAHCRSAGTPLSSVILSTGRPYMKLQELAKLRAAHNVYVDLTKPCREGTYAAYKVSLSSAILKGRRSMWYHPDAYHWFRRRLNYMHKGIRGMVEHYSASISEIRPRLEFKTSFAGEAAALLDDKVLDVRCSMRSNDFAWLLQGLAMVAMASARSLVVVNPQTQTAWEYDCSGWTEESRQNYLAFLS